MKLIRFVIAAIATFSATLALENEKVNGQEVAQDDFDMNLDIPMAREEEFEDESEEGAKKNKKTFEESEDEEKKGKKKTKKSFEEEEAKKGKKKTKKSFEESESEDEEKKGKK